MIIIELQGGLGNQMFQYACGKAFSLKHDQQLFIDASFLDKNKLATNGFTPRKYELSIFNLNEPVAPESLVRSFADISLLKKTFKLLNLPYQKVYNEVPAQNASQLNDVLPPVLLKGYWQSEQYFSDYKSEIRAAFTFNSDSTEKLKEIISQIDQPNSVSIHFRRGDYLTNPVAKKVLGPLSLGYYAEAVKKIQSSIDKPFFYIFSDEPDWVKKNLPVKENYKLIDGLPTNNTHYDMMLMSKCKHHIIANSSFSWWGAWLNTDPGKVVIAPKCWFADEQLNANSIHLVPADWIRL